MADSLPKGQGLKLVILLNKPLYLGQGAVPPVEVLRPLAKYLWRFDFCDVAPELAPPCNNNHTYAPPVTPQQRDAMSHGSLRQLTANIEPRTAAFNPASSIWSALHSLPNLQQLDLTFHNGVSHTRSQFEPLSSLVSLVDLALQSHSRDADCGLVFSSSKSALRQVTLTARCWTAETYRCLSCVPQLEELNLSITDLMGMETY